MSNFVSILKQELWLNTRNFFVLVFIAYFALVTISTLNTGITTDETAHLSAAHSYIQGQGLNPEHPTLLKLLNGLVIRLCCWDGPSENLNQWSRGVEYLTYFDDETSPWILFTSRITYIVFNSIFLIWLFLYTQRFKLLDLNFAKFLAILYTFSPNVITHGGLITFDVAILAAIGCGVVSTYGLIKQRVQSDNFDPKLVWLFIISMGIMVNVKYSGVLFVLLIVFAMGVFTLLYKKVRFKEFWGICKKLILFLLSFTWVINFFAARSYEAAEYTSGIVIKPIVYYVSGFTASFFRSDDASENFFGGQYVEATFGEFVFRVSIFKENPVLIFISLLVFGSIIYLGYRQVKKKNNLTKTLAIKLPSFKPNSLRSIFTKFLEINSHSVLILVTILSAVMGLIYFGLAYNSKFTIGYRHFFPSTILVYIVLASALFWLKDINKYFKNSVVFLLLFYIFFGSLSTLQGVSYVNFLWLDDKYALANDSTINWHQDNIYAYNYVNQLSLNEGREIKVLEQVWRGPFYGYNFHVIIEGEVEFVDNRNGYLTHSLLKDSEGEYLILGSDRLQSLIHEQNNGNETAKANYQYLQDLELEYSRNEVIFVYKL
jgi:hypothetical protein